jgi:hypothetical protein
MQSGASQTRDRMDYRCPVGSHGRPAGDSGAERRVAPMGAHALATVEAECKDQALMLINSKA